MAKKRKSGRRRRRELTAADVSGFFTALLHRFIAGVFSIDKKEPWWQHTRRLAIGAAGGIFYASLKNYTTEGIGVVKLLTMEPGSRRAELFFGYWVAPLMSAAIGAVAAWLSAVRSGRLLFLMGLMGVFIFLSLFPGLQSSGSKTIGQFIDDVLPINFSYAENQEKCVGDSAFMKGFKAFFGSREYYDKYAVVVASGTTRAEAQTKANAVNIEDPTLKLRVGPRACDNDYYPVLATDYLPLTDAKPILEKVRKLKSASDAYLSPGPRE